MTPVFRILLVWLLLVLPAQAGLSERRIVSGGLERSFLVYLPDRLAEPAPLVIVLHGGGGTARQILRSTRERFNRLADRDGFAVIYPDAVDKLWDLGGDPISLRFARRRDDAGFVAAAIGVVAGEVRIDRNRVYAMGISRGGQMSFLLACRHPELVTGIGVVAMGLPVFLERDCRGRRDVPVVLLNGTADPLVPWGGGPISLGRQERGDVLGAEATAALFAGVNGCRGMETVAQVGSVEVIGGRGCRAPVRLYRIEGGGHTWPGERSVLPRFLVGETNRDIDAAAEMWGFFKALK